MATQAMLEQLDAAIARGERVVQYNGKRVEYRSLDELLKARNIIAAQLQGNNQSDVLNRMTVASFSRD